MRGPGAVIAPYLERRVHAELDPNRVSLEPIFDLELRQPFHLGGQVHVPDRFNIREHRAEADRPPLEAAEHGAAAAVRGNLLIDVKIGAAAGVANRWPARSRMFQAGPDPFRGRIS